MVFARRVFFWAGVYGIAVLVPMLFLEERIGRDFPPASNHPEQYYGFVAVALAWQLVFLVIARDVVRFRPLMIPAVLEKLLPAGFAIWLFLGGRLAGVALAPFLVDVLLGALFLASWLRVPARARTGQPGP
jgi:hypothetical protein